MGTSLVNYQCTFVVFLSILEVNAFDVTLINKTKYFKPSENNEVNERECLERAERLLRDCCETA